MKQQVSAEVRKSPAELPSCARGHVTLEHPRKKKRNARVRDPFRLINIDNYTRAKDCKSKSIVTDNNDAKTVDVTLALKTKSRRRRAKNESAIGVTFTHWPKFVFASPFSALPTAMSI